VYEVEVDDVGPSLRNASAKVAKSNRSGGGSGGGGFGGNSGGYGGNSGGRPAAEDPWAADSASDSLSGDTASDEPPF